ncbi:hypothetical protein C2S53_016820 [Perilla frutescens var. hirtella]|uniref:NB-ARC domain-containing protein n=1 Tax=Perilla frutescens var. hirtella TaxID=608512 RepID=A0AAD4P879_PERFH|nr:hypothetical protein C2S53_016820 [Perilla frutescens var. hirtella]
MEKDCIQELQNPNFFQEEDSAATDHSTGVVKMVGLSDAVADLKDHVVRIIRPEDFGVFSFFGDAGNGRSLVAKSIYDDIYINGKERYSFDCGAWVRIGSTNQLKQILLNIIHQMNINEAIYRDQKWTDEYPVGTKSKFTEPQVLLEEEEEEKLGEYLYTSLKGRRYIVALDDIRDTEILIQLRRWLPEQNNGSLVFVTTSLKEVAEFDESFFVSEIPVVWDELLSWSYIGLMMMSGGWLVSAEFEEAGVKIAKNCRGLRLVIAKVMIALLRSEKTLEFWKKLAADEDDPIFMVDDEILENDPK